MLHSSVVLSTITLQDILDAGRWLNGRYYLAYEGFITAMLFYMVLVLLSVAAFGSATHTGWLTYVLEQNKSNNEPVLSDK